MKRCDCCHTTTGKIRQFAQVRLCASCRVLYRAELVIEHAYIERNTLNHFDRIAPDSRLACMIRRLAYGDCLTCGDYTLERQLCQHVSDTEDDTAPDKSLVKGTYTEYMLYHQDRLIGVFDIRADDCTTIHIQQDRYAHYLMAEHGWTVENTRRIIGGAVTRQDTDLLRAKRLVKVPPRTQATRQRRKNRAASQTYQTA